FIWNLHLKQISWRSCTVVRPQLCPQRGRSLTDVTIQEIRLDRKKQFPRLIVAQQADGKRARRLALDRVARVTIDDAVYAAEALPSKSGFVLIDIAARTGAAEQRLQKSRDRFWPKESTEALDHYVKEEREFLETVQRRFGQLSMQLYDTQFFCSSPISLPNRCVHISISSTA
ncbi:MAG: hypothetical protein MK102_19790, partial [Fuerstiella sp.]|nr:hypothetical protein [Fuerstiella sp.]